MNDNNPVGSEYIFMEDVVGKQLAREWDNLFANARTCSHEGVAIEVKLLSVSFEVESKGQCQHIAFWLILGMASPSHIDIQDR